MVLKYTCPNVQAPIVDPKTGMGTKAWYQYLQNIFDTVDVDLLTTTNSWQAQQNFNVIAVTSFSVSNLSVTSASISSLTVTQATVQSITVSNPVTSLTVSNLTVSSLVISSSLTFANPVTNSLTGNVNLNNIAAFFDGPTVTQGTVGTFFVSGSVTVTDTAGVADFLAKLWDGTTIIASARDVSPGANQPVSFSLSGVITNPVGNLRISVQDQSSVSGMIAFNASSLSKDSTLTAFRIA